MGFRPTEQDRNLSAAVQLASGVALFGAAWWVARTRSTDRSPFLSYWLRVSAIWSGIVALLLVGGIVVAVRLGTLVPVVLTIVLHVLSCVMAALAAASDTRFRYFFVGQLFCRRHMERAWPELIEYDELDLAEPAPPPPSQDGIAPPAAPRGPTPDEIREMYPK
jgi:hypothetical protein